MCISIWHLIWHISGILSCILSDIYSDVSSCILSGTLSGISSGILSGISYSFLSGISSGILSGRWGPAVHTELGRSQVEVQQCPLQSGSRGWGPAVPTAIWKSQLRSSSDVIATGIGSESRTRRIQHDPGSRRFHMNSWTPKKWWCSIPAVALSTSLWLWLT